MVVESDWGDWLLRDVEAASPDGLAVWYLGCNGFILKSSGGTTLYIDPYLGTGDPPRTVRMIPVPFNPRDVTEADAVLITHEHSDHLDGPSQGPILGQTGADLYAPNQSIAAVEEREWANRWDLQADQPVAVEPGMTFTVGDLTVHVEPANDPDAVDPVSYVIQHDETTVIHGGDARPGQFDAIGDTYDIDVGILAFGTVGMIPDKETREPVRKQWYNDENMIIEAANELQLDTLVPSHWDMWKGMTTDPTVLHNHMNSFDYPATLDIAEIGDRVEYPH
jgi:L-ascorbate 6-phosphate lactonase